MRNQVKATSKWVLPVLILVLMIAGCSGGSGETIATTLPRTSAATDVPPTAAPAATEELVEPPTPAPLLTAEPTLDELDQGEHEHILYESDFTELDERWPLVQEFDNSYIGFHEPEWYHVEVHSPFDDEVVTLKGESYEDITTEVVVFAEPSLTEPEGDFRYGLVFRRAGKQWYAFVVSPKTQSWWVLKSSPSGLEVLEEGNHNSIHGVGEKDTLRLDAVGSDFSFQINDQLVTQVNDEDYKTGEVGFFVETFDSPKAHIHYDFLSIREAETLKTDEVFYESDFTELDERWPLVQEFDNSYIGFHEPEWYHVEVHSPFDDEVVTLKGESYEDITTEVVVFAEPSLTEPEGDFRYGLVFRREGKQWYAFVISPKTQSWWVLKSSPTGLEVLKQGSYNSIQGLGTKDTLRLDAEGSNFYFHLNDQFITQVSDGDYDSGEVGFFVETFDSPKAHIHYDFLSIRGVEPPQFMCDVIAQALNLRSGPSTSFSPPIAILTQGDQFEPLERTPNGLWIRVRLNGSDLSGWVANSPGYVTCNVAVGDLPESQP
jgi:predicted DNA-binding protein (MmcQ/YjbR family)